METIYYPNVVMGKRRRFMTVNLTPGKRFFEESLIREGAVEYREWDAMRSKLAAGMLNRVKETGIREGANVLYLGASHGYTVSYVSDIVGKKGFVFAIDFAPRVVRDLVMLCEQRPNIAPMLADCNHPETYAIDVPKVDVVFQDIAQRNQVEIFVKNLKMFLKPNGVGLLALKARSVDITKSPNFVFSESRKGLEKHVQIVDQKSLEPFERDHCMFVCRLRK